MIIYSHRGNTENDSQANSRPSEIRNAIKLGYHCEIDLWAIQDRLFLGHSFEEAKFQEIQWARLLPMMDKLLIHAKNSYAFSFLIQKQVAGFSNMHFFWHENDTYTLTNKGIPVVYPGKPVIRNSIVMLPEQSCSSLIKDTTEIFGVCSDVPDFFR